MRTKPMGRVTVKVRIENLSDHLRARAETLKPDKVRAVEVENALVDTGAKFISLPGRLIKSLGLELVDTQKAITAAGVVHCNIYSAVRLTIEGRDCTIDVAEVADESPVLIGYIPLELLDFVVDPKKQRLISDPRMGDERLLDLF